MRGTGRRRTLLILSQVFVPDPAAVGQQLADTAVAMVTRGHRVVVYTSQRGYENPDTKHPRRENYHGVDVRRLPFCSFGKRSILTRVAGTLSFMLQALVLGCFEREVDGIFFSTSPPLIGVIACLLRIVRGVPIAYWAMDLNPDQLIALGKLRETDWVARLLESVNRMILRRSSLVIALDTYMARRLQSRGRKAREIAIVPPWFHEDQLGQRHLNTAENAFRVRHGLSGKFVVMYSGNHSPSNPLATILDAAVQLKDDPHVRFAFVGGGALKRDIEHRIAADGLPNVLSLPYQPVAELADSLSAADLHVVSLGDAMAGILHPCKVYGVMAVARPVLYVGPRPSHITDILDAVPIGRRIAHGDVAGAVRSIRELKELCPQARTEMGLTARRFLTGSRSQACILDRLCGHLERTLQLTPPAKDAVNAGSR